MKKYIIIYLTFLVAFSPHSTSQVGTTGISFLKIGVAARNLAMGDVMTLDKSDPSSIYYNPATMGLSNNSMLVLMHREWVEDTRTEYFGALLPAGKFRFGVGLNLTSIDNIEIRTVPGPSQGTFSSKNSTLGLSASYGFDNILFGFTGKFLYEKILIDEATGYALDFGAVYITPWMFQVGLAINNIGSMNELRNESSTLPTMIRIGGSKIFNFEDINSAVVAVTEFVSVFKEQKSHIHIGTEFCYQDMFSLRAGIQTNYQSRFFSTGVGFKHGIFAVDYAFVPFQYDFGSTHIISVIINL
jgi:hypothetical protein